MFETSVSVRYWVCTQFAVLNELVEVSKVISKKEFYYKTALVPIGVLCRGGKTSFAFKN